MDILLSFLRELKAKVPEDELYVMKNDEISYVHHWVNVTNDEKGREFLSHINVAQKEGSTLAVFKYNKTFIFEALWDEMDGIYRHCRGAVVDLKTCEYVLRPWSKFFNVGEPYGYSEEEIIALTEKYPYYFTEKLDGSMVSATWTNYIEVSSSGQLSEDSHVVKFSKRFLIIHKNYWNFLKKYAGYTCMFEMISSTVDPHVVNYMDSKFDESLVLTGVINTRTGEELPREKYVDDAKALDLFVADIIPMNIVERLAYAKDPNGVNGNVQEGVVISIVKDNTLVHAKLKNFNFLNAQRIKHNLPAVEIYLDDNADDIVASLHPKIAEELLEKLQHLNALENIVKEMAIDWYEKNKDLDTKSYMEKVNRMEYKVYDSETDHIKYEIANSKILAAILRDIYNNDHPRYEGYKRYTVDEIVNRLLFHPYNLPLVYNELLEKFPILEEL